MLTDPGIIPRPENVHDRVSSQAALSADSPVPLNLNLQVEETENRGAYSGVYLGVYARPIAHQVRLSNSNVLIPNVFKNFMNFIQLAEFFSPEISKAC
jgi:hypothetical protein